MRPEDPDNFPKPPKKSLHDLPDATKKKIIIITVVIFGLIFFTVWANSFLQFAAQSLQKIGGDVNQVVEDPELQKIRQDLDQMIDKNKQTLDQLIKEAKQLSATTSDQKISDEETEQLKNKLLELKFNQEQEN